MYLPILIHPHTQALGYQAIVYDSPRGPRTAHISYLLCYPPVADQIGIFRQCCIASQCGVASHRNAVCQLDRHILSVIYFACVSIRFIYSLHQENQRARDWLGKRSSVERTIRADIRIASQSRQGMRAPRV
jgi:hypothetical protein